MEISKFIFLFFLLITVHSKEKKNPIEINERIKFGPSFYEDNSDNQEILEKNKMKELLGIYIESKNWTPKTQLDETAFIRLFIYVTSKSLFKKSTREQLSVLAEKVIDIHGQPINIENIKNYFDYDELKKVYEKLLK